MPLAITASNRAGTLGWVVDLGAACRRSAMTRILLAIEGQGFAHKRCRPSAMAWLWCLGLRVADRSGPQAFPELRRDTVPAHLFAAKPAHGVIGVVGPLCRRHRANTPASNWIRLGRETLPGTACSDPTDPRAGRAGGPYVSQIPSVPAGRYGTRLWLALAVVCLPGATPAPEVSHYQPI